MKDQDTAIVPVVQDCGQIASNRLRMLGAPGFIVEGNTVTIGADVFEFRSSTPPLGGTAGRIWVYAGADSAASRANFIKAVSRVVDTAVVTRTAQVSTAGTNTARMRAYDGTTVGDIDILGYDYNTNQFMTNMGMSISCTETLATATDVWDAPIVLGGAVGGYFYFSHSTVTVTANMIARGILHSGCPAPVAGGYWSGNAGFVLNRNRRTSDTRSTSNNSGAIITSFVGLAGGASPRTQPNDVYDFFKFYL